VDKIRKYPQEKDVKTRCLPAMTPKSAYRAEFGISIIIHRLVDFWG